MKIKEMYQYFWYKIYKCMEYQELWPNLRTGLIVGAIEGILIVSLFLYYHIFITREVALPDNIVWWIVGICLIPLAIIEYIIIHRKNQWVVIIEKFDQWPKKKNFRGTIIVWSVVLLIIANLILVLWLPSQMDWYVSP